MHLYTADVVLPLTNHMQAFYIHLLVCFGGVSVTADMLELIRILAVSCFLSHSLAGKQSCLPVGGNLFAEEQYEPVICFSVSNISLCCLR